MVKTFAYKGDKNSAIQSFLSSNGKLRSVVNGKELASYTYTEFGSENRQGGFSFLNQDNKIVKQYEGSNPQGCHVAIMDKYLSLLPAEAKDQDIFYLTPLSKCPDDPRKS